MPSVTYSFNFGERTMSDEVEYPITVSGSAIPSNAVITSGSFSFTIGIASGYSSSETMRLRKFYINSSESYIGYGKAYGDSTWWDTSNRVYFKGNQVVRDSSPSAFTSGSFTLLQQLSYGGTFRGVNGREGSITINYQVPSLSSPGAPTVTQSGSNYVLSWAPAYGSGSSGDVTYYVLVDGDMYVWPAGTATSLTHAIPSEYYGVSASFSVRADYGGMMAFSSGTSFTAQHLNPTITAQPSITSMNPTSGQSTTINWSAASVSNQGSSTIYYQYFVGPSSTYSDSYHVGTTTGLSATITEANILSKCGSGFDGVCYIFVRAYWDNGSTNGGWTTPTGKAFTYTPHRTVKYYNGSSWIECIPYYYNGSSWIECVPYYYNGSSWIECSH